MLLAIRVPDSVGYCREIGLDVEQWLKDGLIDLMVASGYFRLNPWAASVELGHKYGVKVFACLSETRLRDPEARKTRASTACYRARALNAWRAGVDAVYLFNSFNPTSPLWRELGDPAMLQTMERVYTTGARDVRGAESWLNGGMRFVNRTPVSPHQPVTLTAGAPATIELRVGDNIANSKAQRETPEVELRIRISAVAGPEQLASELNGTRLADGKMAGGWIEYPVDPSLVKQGVNRFTLTLSPKCKEKAKVEDLLLWVHPR